MLYKSESVMLEMVEQYEIPSFATDLGEIRGSSSDRYCRQQRVEIYSDLTFAAPVKLSIAPNSDKTSAVGIPDIH